MDFISSLYSEFVSSDDLHDYLKILDAVLLSLTVLIGTVGNSLTLVVYCLYADLRKKVGSWLIINLAISDLCGALLCTPFQLMGLLTGKQPFDRDGLCQYVAFIFYQTLFTSLLTITILAILRCRTICFPYRAQFLTQPGLRPFMITLTWVLPAITLTFPLANIKSKFDFSEKLLFCAFDRTESRTFLNFIICIYELLPFVVCIICYSLMVKTVRQSKNRCHTARIHCTHTKCRKKKLAKNNCDNYATFEEHETKLVPCTMNQTKQGRPPTEEEIKLAIMFFVLFLAFLICNLPFTIVNLVDQESTASQNYYVTEATCISMNYMANPCIYSIMNGNFRKAIRRLFRCLPAADH